MVTPQISFVTWMKRLPNGQNEQEGILGNSNNPNVTPTFNFLGTHNKNYVQVSTNLLEDTIYRPVHEPGGQVGIPCPLFHLAYLRAHPLR